MLVVPDSSVRGSQDGLCYLKAVLLICVGVSLVGCGSSSQTAGEMEPAQQAEWLLSKDKRYSNRMARQKANGISSEKAVANYVESIHAIDLSPLPSDLRSAYHEHRVAWESYEQQAGQMPELDMASVINVGQAVGRIVGSEGTDLLAWKSLLTSAVGTEETDQEGPTIESTWQDVQRLAVRLGATIEVKPYRYPDEKMVVVREIRVEDGNWDPNLLGAGPPDIRLSVLVNDTPMCRAEGKDSYNLSPECRFLIRPDTEVEIDVVDDDLNRPDPIGTWKGHGGALIEGGLSFDEVLRISVERGR